MVYRFVVGQDESGTQTILVTNKLLEQYGITENTFGRMESIWKPVAANEGFEVVRRRLFLDCKDEAARDAVCDAFSSLYLDNSEEFPLEAKEVEYRDRLVSCYPLHPEVFDRL